MSQEFNRMQKLAGLTEIQPIPGGSSILARIKNWLQDQIDHDDITVKENYVYEFPSSEHPQIHKLMVYLYKSNFNTPEIKKAKVNFEDYLEVRFDLDNNKVIIYLQFNDDGTPKDTVKFYLYK